MREYGIGKFEKVSFDEFMKSLSRYKTNFSYLLKEDENFVHDMIYDKIQLPQRATVDSAGYDFFFPFLDDETINPGETIIIPTGIKVNIFHGWHLNLYPRSGLSFEYPLRLVDTVSIIDGDYYNNPKNEGHIIVKLTNENSSKICKLEQGMGYLQGIFHEYGVTIDDHVTATRTGGFGSTTKQKFKRFNPDEEC